MSLVWFMLCSGFVHFTFSTNRLRIFNFTGTPGKNWSDSLQECKMDPSASLVTLYDEEDFTFVINFLTDIGHDKTAWFGLHKHKQPHRVATWSNGEPFKCNHSNVNLANGTQRCGAIENKTWADFNCSDQLSFMCYKDDVFTLIENENRNWCEALQYCRRHYTDLVTISNETQHQQVIDKGKNDTFWIGLMYDEWKWADNSCSTFRTWGKDLKESSECAILSHSGSSMIERACDERSHTLCSKGK
uniref:C-type lectin domain-containing protein n=1 Tax=Lates calcarifer TaxID=8187 RepID=A0A4W6BJK0_LATCA